MCNSNIDRRAGANGGLFLAAVSLIFIVSIPADSFANKSIRLGSVGSVPLGVEIELSVVYVNPHPEESVIESELLLSYPAAFLEYLRINPTPLDGNCSWVHFNVTQPADSLLRISARADPGGNCLDSDSVLLATIRFRVSADLSAECESGLFSFVWQDCLDNILVSEDGSIVLVSDTMFADPNTWPTPPTGRGATDSCVADVNGIRGVNFYAGAVGVDCEDVRDDRGDVNLNGIAYEIADLVLFTNYFIVGPSAFGDHWVYSARATDVNNDGISLTLIDWVYLHKVISGDTVPYPRSAVSDTALVIQDLTNQTLSIDYGPGLAGLWIKFAGDITASPLFDTSSGIYLTYHFDSTYTRVLVIHPFVDLSQPVLSSGPVMSYAGSGNIVEYDLADWSGVWIPSVLLNTGGSCCVGMTGNVNNMPDLMVDISDVTALVKFLFCGSLRLPCPAAADVTDGTGEVIDISDLTALIEYLLVTFTPPEQCASN